MRNLIVIVLGLVCLSTDAQKTVKTYYDPYSKTKIREQYTIDAKGQKNGSYKGYDETGMVLLEYNYVAGRMQGECIEYSNDNGKRRMVAKLNYKNSELNGNADYYGYVCGVKENDPGFAAHADKEFFEGKWCLWTHTGHFTYVDGYKSGEFWTVVEKHGYLIKETHVQRSKADIDSQCTGSTYVSTGKTYEVRKAGNEVRAGDISVLVDTIIGYDMTGKITEMLLMQGNTEIGYAYGGLYPSGANKAFAIHNHRNLQGSDGYLFSEDGCLTEADAVKFKMQFDSVCFHVAIDMLVATRPEDEKLVADLNYLGHVLSYGMVHGRKAQPCTWELYKYYNRDPSLSMRENIRRIEDEEIAKEQERH